MASKTEEELGGKGEKKGLERLKRYSLDRCGRTLRGGTGGRGEGEMEGGASV